MEAVGAGGHRQFSLQMDMRCPCKGCVGKVEEAMASIGRFKGVETSVGDVDTGIVTVTGKVNPEELCEWLKSKTRKHVSIVCSDLPVDKKIIFTRGSNPGTGSTTPSAPSSCPWGVRSDSDHEDVRLIEDQIRDLERARDRLKIRSLEKELDAAKREVGRSREVNQVISDGKKALLKAYNKLDSLDRSRFH